MIIYIGSDHAGFHAKSKILDYLLNKGYNIEDCGAYKYNSSDSYTEYIFDVATKVSKNNGSYGIVLGGSGNGEAIAANKVKGIRAIIAWNNETARLGRVHNNANIISFGARMISIDLMLEMIEIFLNQKFDIDSRHTARIEAISKYEESNI